MLTYSRLIAFLASAPITVLFFGFMCWLVHNTLLALAIAAIYFSVLELLKKQIRGDYKKHYKAPR